MDQARKLVLLLFVTVSVGCSATVLTFRANDFGGSSKDGLVIASTRIAAACATSPAFINLTSDNGKSKSFLIDDVFVTPDFVGPPGYFNAQPFPPGNWHIDSVHFGDYVSVANQELGHSFQVTAGKAIYLGQLLIVSADCKRFGIVATDEWNRDSVLFTSKVKNVSAASVEKQILIEE